MNSACELERIDLSVITKKDESHIVLVKLLKDFLHELTSRYVSVIQKVKSVLYVHYSFYILLNRV